MQEFNAYMERVRVRRVERPQETVGTSMAEVACLFPAGNRGINGDYWTRWARNERALMGDVGDMPSLLSNDAVIPRFLHWLGQQND